MLLDSRTLTALVDALARRACEKSLSPEVMPLESKRYF